MKIAMPMVKYKNIYLEPDEECTLFFYSKDSIFGAKGVVTDRNYEGNIAICGVKLSTKPEKMQRRQFYRINCSLGVQAHLLSEEEEKVISEINVGSRIGVERLNEYLDMLAETVPDWEEDDVIDLSGGGIRFLSDDQKDKDKMYLMAMQLKDDVTVKEYHILLKIVASEKRIINGIIRYENRAEYVKLKEKDREQIVKFVFEIDRRIRQHKSGTDLN
jgi:c-di-GMP-binding flagellar brake protein YcgR